MVAVIFCGALHSCATADHDLCYVGAQHLRDVRPAPFHIAIRTFRVATNNQGAPAADEDTLPSPTREQLDSWDSALAARLVELNVSAVGVEPSDQPLPNSPYDLAIEVHLDWQAPLQTERHNLLGSGLAWGFLWPFSVTSIAAVNDRSYETAVRATVNLVWADAQEQREHQSIGELLLSFPERQPSIWWKIAAFSPLYFWVPDDPVSRTECLHSHICDRLAILVARMIKLNETHLFTGYSWQGDRLQIDAPDGVQVAVVGGTRTPDPTRQRYLIPREADRVRLAITRTAAGQREGWTQTIRRKAP